MKTRSVGTWVRWTGVFALVLGGACTDRDKDGTANGDGPFSLGGDLALEANPDPVVFSPIPLLTETSQIITLTHKGGEGTLKLSNLRLETASADLAVGTLDRTSLLPGEIASFEVSYAPKDDAKDEGVIKIDTNIAAIAGGSLVFEIEVSTGSFNIALVASPEALDFAGVPSGTSQTKTVSVVNSGTLEATITGFVLDPAGDFDLVTSPEVPFGLPPGKAFDLQATYTPTKGDADSDILSVLFEINGAKELPIKLSGVEVAAILVVNPLPLDFGKRAAGQTHSLPLVLSNAGNAELVVTGIVLQETSGWAKTIEIPAFGPDPVVLDGSAVHTLMVSFTPTTDMPILGSPIAGIAIASNDAVGSGSTLVPVFGRPEAPSLQVNPPDSLDFGYVAQNLTSTRTVSLYNAGSADLTVDALALEPGQDSLAGEWVMTAPVGIGPDGVIGPGVHQEVSISFTNKGGAGGVAWGTLRVTSNDPALPDWPVVLKASRAGQPSCEIALVPDVVDYGIVPRGFAKTMSFQIVNVGSGACGYLGALVNNCGSFSFLPGLAACDDPATTAKEDGTSTVYKVTAEPFAAANNLKPGMSYPLKVTFTPPSTAPLIGDELTDYAGLLALRITHNYTADGSLATEIFPKPAGSSYVPNLHGKSGMAELSAFPSPLDFSAITIGCASQTLTLNAYNVGTAPLDLTNWELTGCSPEFKTVSYPALNQPDGQGGYKLTLDPGAGVQFELQYVPQDTGDDACALALYTNGATTPAATVPLAGKGTYETEHTDEFVQTSGQDVDILFVVDNSGSMSEEQQNLSKNFQNFISQASAWNNQYHVAVVTTDIDGDSGLLQGTPRYVTNSDWQKFAANVKVGELGSGTEQGLIAAQLALSLPLASDPGTACTSDLTCSAPDACVEGFCGGYNRGFMRQDAALEIVFVSDEEDQSPSDLNFYINFFKSIKGVYNSNLLHCHAIVGPPGDCSSASGDAAAGYRYMDVANATGGNVISICEPDFTTGLKSIGEIAFGLKVQFFLTRQPVPSTLEVKNDGVPCTSAGGANWSYDAGSNSVVFMENGGCMPQPGQNVWIHYETECLIP
jgi:hypothetical protein